MKTKYPVKFKIPWLKKTTKSRKVPKRADIPKGMKSTYNILQTPKVIEAFHPQFIGIDKDAIRDIEDRNDVIVINSKPVKASITFFKGRIPISHVNLKKVI
jgi:hypothetical protein